MKNNPSQYVIRILTTGITMLSCMARAHPGHFHPGEEDEFDSFAAGLVHPFSSVGHLAVVIAAVAAGYLLYSTKLREGKWPIALIAFAGIGLAFAQGSDPAAGSAAGFMVCASLLLGVGAGFAKVRHTSLNEKSILG
jgi:hydrogenase/urease accessory protein HupE